jgi:aryl-alcohol dehydrogenase-like predicted oxidoreductase
LYGYLIHGPEYLFEVPNAWEELLIAKEKGLVQKIGFSLYKPELLFKLIEAGMHPDLIQVQYNVLDRRFEPFFVELKQRGIEIHTRSAFIQGLFFLDNLPEYLKPLQRILSDIHLMYPEERVRAAALLSFCIGNEGIDKVVIGLNRKEELELNLSDFITPESNKLFNLVVPEIDEEIFLPYNWPIYRQKV